MRLWAFLVAAIYESIDHANGVFTTNPVCRRSYCINPIFPGLEDLGRLSNETWACSTLQKSSPHMPFCGPIIGYAPALPVPVEASSTEANSTSIDPSVLAKNQDNAAATMFVYHVAGMGLEAWDYQKPEDSDDDCVKSIWRMVCYTYFPRAQSGCEEGSYTPYVRPCQSSCTNYIRACGVECCDESVQCVFEHETTTDSGLVLTTEGYSHHAGPSSFCTGAASQLGVSKILVWALLLLQSISVDGGIIWGFRYFMPIKWGVLFRNLLLGLVAAIACVLHGCDFEVPSHTVGNWRGEPDYLVTYGFVVPGGSASDGRLNTCSLEGLAETLQCSGRGMCKMWGTGETIPSLSFCECDRDWADPECQTRRKSQAVAFFLSLFLGFLGADQFYMGFVERGLLKLFTLGAGGLWWIWDIVRIGSGPVQTYNNFRLSNDLAHWVYVLIIISAAASIGFLLAATAASTTRSRRMKELLLRQRTAPPVDARWPQNSLSRTMHLQQGYGATPTPPGGSRPDNFCVT